jgi:hypothetical protein
MRLRRRHRRNPQARQVQPGLDWLLAAAAAGALGLVLGYTLGPAPRPHLPAVTYQSPPES